MTTEPVTSAAVPGEQPQRAPRLSARLEPFDSYWQSPEDVESGYKSFYEYYRHNYLPHMPADKSAEILVISCGPGYLVNLLKSQGYTRVLGIDSDADKIEWARRKELNCRQAQAFPFLEQHLESYDSIIAEQELNHLTLEETLQFLALCKRSLRDGGLLMVYGLNGANPLVGAENLAQNIDHFYTFTEYSLKQILELAGFRKIEVMPLKVYVFWKNPLNYIGIVATGLLEFCFRIGFKLYGKNARVMSKKLAAICYK